ncbi:MAG: response regulator transcription factor [Chloroflexi bacterium]|nr:response regulator transcription factor [Chloroflexota bacterium]
MDATILLVDDEPMVTDVVERYLRREGFQVLLAADGEAAVATARESAPDLIILDLMLPKIDGLTAFRQIRSHSSVPVIILTAKGEETDRIVGLETGADDYIAKPFSPREVVARVKAVLRRAGRAAAPASGDSIRFDQLLINPRTRDVHVDRRKVELTAKEFDLLWFLASNPGDVFTRAQLLDQVWDFQYAGDASTVTVHIRRLRLKIEADPDHPRYIKTVWGVGYKFVP